jgi:hypothetical protein
MRVFSEEELNRFEVTFTFDQLESGANNIIETHNAAIMVLYMIALLEVSERIVTPLSKSEQFESLAWHVNDRLAILLDLESWLDRPDAQFLIRVRSALANNLYFPLPDYRLRFRSGSAIVQVLCESLPSTVTLVAVVLLVGKAAKWGVDVAKATLETVKALQDVSGWFVNVPADLHLKRLDIEQKQLEIAQLRRELHGDVPLSEDEIQQVEQQQLELNRIFASATSLVGEMLEQAPRLRIVQKAMDEEPMELKKLKVRRKLSRKPRPQRYDDTQYETRMLAEPDTPTIQRLRAEGWEVTVDTEGTIIASKRRS